MFAYLVTLAYGDVEVPTLAQVVFLSHREGEDATRLVLAGMDATKVVPLVSMT